MCECPVRMWFVVFLGVEVALKDVGVPFNYKGLSFQSVGMAYQDMGVPCQGVGKLFQDL